MKDQSKQISLFYCSNSLQEEDLSILCSKIKDIKIISIGLPCSGKVNLLYLLKAVETGSDGVLVVSCKFSDCKYLQGNYRARKRIEFIDELPKTLSGKIKRNELRERELSRYANNN